MKHNVLFKAFLMLISIATLSSCNKKDELTIDLTNGKLIVCEGTFQTNTGDLTLIQDTISANSVYQQVNGNPLGDVAQSLAIIDNKAFIVVNNSQKIEVIDMKTTKSIGIIDGFSFPRSITALNSETLLVTNGDGHSNNYVYVIDAKSLTITDSLTVGLGPEKVIVANEKIWICNSGQWTNDNTISVFDATTLDSLTTIEVSDLPIDMVVKDNNLYVMCKGLTEYAPVEPYEATVISNSKLVSVNTDTYEVSTILDMDHQLGTFSVNVLAIAEDGTLYYTDDAIYSVDASGNTEKIIDGYFYSVDVDPTNGNIWVGNTNSITQHTMDVYTNTGTKVTSYNTDKYPNSVIFQ